MDSNHFNVTRGLVQAILILTTEQRRSLNIQSVCQMVHCIFSINAQDEPNNDTCYVTSGKESSLTLNASIAIEKVNPIVYLIQFIRLYLYPLFIFMGIFGNSLSCLIMFLNVRRNGYPANFYLTLLAFVDCLFLLGSAVPEWLSHIHVKLDIRFLTHLSCRLRYWFGNFTTHLSAGLVVSVTVERFIAIQYPLIAHKTNTPRHTHMVLIILISFFFVLDSRVLILVKNFHESIHSVLTCHNDTSFRYERRDFFHCTTTSPTHGDIWVLIDFAVYTIIPFLIIVTLNSLIIRRLISAQRLREKMIHFDEKKLFREKSSQILRRSRSVPSSRSIRPSASRTSPLIDQRHLRSSIRKTSVSIDLTLETRNSAHHSSDVSSTRFNSITVNNTRLTVLLLFVSCAFFVLTLPAVVINLILVIKSKSQSTSLHSSAQFYADGNHSKDVLYYTIARLLMIINHSINFILYFLVGKRFRRDLKRLFFQST